MFSARNNDINGSALSIELPLRSVCRMLSFVFLIPVGLCFFISACSPKDDVTVIRKIIQKAARSAEDHHIADLMDLTAGDFMALPGHYDVRMVKSILFGVFKRYGQFRIHYPQPAVDVTADGRDASTIIYFLIVRRNQSIPGLKELYNDPRRWLEAVGEKADLYQLKLQLKKKDGDWLVQQADLEGFKGTGF
jgi:hypothetical protein